MTAVETRLEELVAATSGEAVDVADILCDRHPADATAFTLVRAEPDSDTGIATRTQTYGELREASERVAQVLTDLGVGPGDRVATLMGKSEHYAPVVLGIWRLGGVHVPLFTAFAPSAIAARLLPSEAKVVVADPSQAAKLLPSEDLPAGDWQVLLAGTPEDVASVAEQTRSGRSPGGWSTVPSLTEEMARVEPGFASVSRPATDPIITLFTSGTTGTPKAVPVPIRAIGYLASYVEFGLDVRQDDVFWNVADPGWAYGLYYGIVAPLALGRPNILLVGGFRPELMWAVTDNLGVTNLAGAPTVFRALRAAGVPPSPSGGPRQLRVISSAGEPLNPEMMTWAEQNLGQTIRDHYGQTEMGMCIINAWVEPLQGELRPGSMGRPLPGYAAAVLADLDDTVLEPGQVGRVAIDVPHSPGMWFTGYAYGDRRTADRFSADGRWYYTGDAGRVDEDGYFFFSSRDDDVILMAGYRIGPFEVESTLMTHPAVAESAAIGVPDELRGEVLEAYVVTVPGAQPGDELAEELKQHVKKHYAAHAYPRAIHFVDELPKTPSGKVRRVELRARRRADRDA